MKLLNDNKIVSPPKVDRNDSAYGLNWKDNPSSRKLLDVIISILVENYVRIIKENPEMFKEIGGSK